MAFQIAVENFFAIAERLQVLLYLIRLIFFQKTILY